METRITDVEITEPNGDVIFSKKNVEIPEQWSDRAATIAASKYFSYKETSALTLVSRITKQIMLWGTKQKYFKDEEEANNFMHSLEEILLDQRAAFNSPVWFNVGVKEQNNQVAACFIYGVEDNMEDILEHGKREGLTFRSGSGAGVNVSKLRAKGELLSNRGVASGPISFMSIWDQTAGSIKSGGRTRRSAKIVIMDINHPDIEEFIDCKLHEEKKAKILIENGVSQEEAYATVSFQNANHSIMITDEFMEAVQQDTHWDLINRGNGEVNRTVKAKELFRKIAYVAWETGDPGLQFYDRINIDNPVPSLGNIECANPCFTGDMKLLTSVGYKRFDELEGSTPNIINREGRVTQSKVWCSGIKPVYEIKFHWKAGIDSITCTEDHQFSTLNGPKVAIDLKGNRIKPFVKSREELGNSNEILAGYIQGDGNTGRLNADRHKGMEVFIGNKDSDVAKLFKVRKDEIKENNNGAWYSHRAMEVAKNYSLDSRNLPERELPEWMRDGCYHSEQLKEKKDFLCGLFSANGCVINRTRVAFKTTCKQLAEQLKEVLYGLKITSYITVNKPTEINWDNGTYTSKQSYDINIHRWKDLKTFAEEINFIQRYKQEELLKTINERSPVVTSVNYINEQKVYDFIEPETHWGVVNGFIVHNCTEHVAINGSACNLSSMNLVKYLDKNNEFDYKKFDKDIQIMITAQDIMIDPSDYPTEYSKKVAIKTRPLGLGFANLGAYLMLKGLPYDSFEARQEAAQITKEMTTSAYVQSIRLAKKVGPYEAYKENKITNEKLVKTLTCSTEIRDTVSSTGLRNSQLTCLAPTGTISFLMDCDSTGIEPLFALKSYKKLAGGGTLEMAPKCVEKAVDKIVREAKVWNGEVAVDLVIPQLPKEQQAIFKTANEISPKGHLSMMTACQQYLNGAISKTVNLPSSCTVEDVENTYLQAWKMKLKSIAIYRDGCKMMQPLTVKREREELKLEEINEEKWTAFRKKLPNTRHSITHKFNIAGFEAYLTCGMYENGNLGEIFIRTQKEGSTVYGLLDGFATAVSLALQYGVPLDTFIDKFTGSKFDPAGITENEDIRIAKSIFDYIARFLKQNFLDDDDDDVFINETEVSNSNVVKAKISFDGPPCSQCQTITGRSGSCYVCPQCGTTNGCS